jgi:sortase (surface protein transpeptidase)
MSLVCLVVLAAGLLVELVSASHLTERSAQTLELATFRQELAEGTAPVGPTDSAGHLLRHGAPVALLEIPSIGLHQIVGEGTTPSDLFRGPGHRRDSPLPGQVGVSVILARRAAFGGPFGRVAGIRKGSMIRVTTGQGRFTYRVMDVRGAGDPVPAAPGTGVGRLVLVTAAGRAYVPAGVWRVDAELTTAGLGGPAPLLTSQTLPSSERLMGSDPGAFWALALWLEFLIVLVLGATWAWQRWGRGQTWIVFLPLLALVSLNVSEEVIRLLPNLL